MYRELATSFEREAGWPARVRERTVRDRARGPRRRDDILVSYLIEGFQGSASTTPQCTPTSVGGRHESGRVAPSSPGAPVREELGRMVMIGGQSRWLWVICRVARLHSKTADRNFWQSFCERHFGVEEPLGPWHPERRRIWRRVLHFSGGGLSSLRVCCPPS